MLSIDIEGEDIKVINDTFEEGFKPHWIIAEASYGMTIHSLDQLDLVDGFKKEYKIFASTHANILIEKIN